MAKNALCIHIQLRPVGRIFS